MIRRLLPATAALALWSAAGSAQTSVSLGVGGGIVASTESSLSDGKSGVVGMFSLTRSLLPLIGIGAEADYLRRTGAETIFGAGFVKVHLPVVPLGVKLGVAYGNGDPDGNGKISGVGAQVGATYDVTLPAVPIALTIFGNAFLAHGSSRYLQMVDAGIALTWK
jgi:hypothetical protein